MNYSFTEDQWGQGRTFGAGRACLLGHMSRAGRRGAFAGYLLISIRALFPERTNDSAVVAAFNDHPDTTFEDVQLVWKHAVHALEETS